MLRREFAAKLESTILYFSCTTSQYYYYKWFKGSRPQSD